MNTKETPDFDEFLMIDGGLGGKPMAVLTGPLPGGHRRFSRRFTLRDLVRRIYREKYFGGWCDAEIVAYKKLRRAQREAYREPILKMAAWLWPRMDDLGEPRDEKCHEATLGKRDGYLDAMDQAVEELSHMGWVERVRFCMFFLFRYGKPAKRKPWPDYLVQVPDRPRGLPGFARRKGAQG